jgi:hypothetical protein
LRKLGDDLNMEESEYMTKVDFIGKTTIERARKFASEMVKTVSYADCGQIDNGVVERNIFFGRLGEEAACIAFRGMKYKVEGPDYTIYKAKEKRWKYDLVIRNDKREALSINVMTQAASVAVYHGVNWVIQSIDKGRKDPLLSNPESLLCLVELDDSRRWFPCIVYTLYKIGDLKISEAGGKYKSTKKVIKKEDLPCFADTKDKTEQTGIDNAWGCF